MPIVQDTRELARELGVLGSVVHINDDWVDYDERHLYLLDADAGVSTHRAHLETTLSFRTRILDYLWCELPIVVTDGDFFADLVRDRGLGMVVAPGDVAGLADALESVLFDEVAAGEYRSRIARVRSQFEWASVLRPLVRYIENPLPAADLSARKRRKARSRHGPLRDLVLAWRYLRTSGPRAVWTKVRARLGR